MIDDICDCLKAFKGMQFFEKNRQEMNVPAVKQKQSKDLDELNNSCGEYHGVEIFLNTGPTTSLCT